MRIKAITYIVNGKDLYERPWIPTIGQWGTSYRSPEASDTITNEDTVITMIITLEDASRVVHELHSSARLSWNRVKPHLEPTRHNSTHRGWRKMA